MENSNQENLDLIVNMIRTAQRRFYDDSRYYILWGCTVFFASIIQYLLILSSNTQSGIGWLVLIPSALVVQFIIVRKQKKKEKSKTHIEKLMVSMWIAFGVTLFIILTFSFKFKENTFPIILCLYALTTFVSGSAFKIKAFIFGSIACWILAIVSFFISIDIQLLLLAAGVLFAFIIPGIILRVNEKAELI
jgi:hypothetical protein